MATDMLTSSESDKNSKIKEDKCEQLELREQQESHSSDVIVQSVTGKKKDDAHLLARPVWYGCVTMSERVWVNAPHASEEMSVI